MTDSLALAIDQGTHATRCMLVDMKGCIRFSAFADIGLKRRGELHVEQDPGEILASVRTTLDAALSASKGLGDIVCAGLAIQRSSVVAWDRVSGKALTPVISWQDRRAARWLQELSAFSRDIKNRSGLPPSPHYGGSKLRWMSLHQENVKTAMAHQRLAWGPLASYLLFHLLDESPYIVDYANAQRTQMWNLFDHCWDSFLTDLFQIPPDSLPETVPNCRHHGRLKAADIPLSAVTGDQNAAFFSMGRTRKDTLTVNMGTGAFLLAPTGSKKVLNASLLSGILNTHAHGRDLYMLEGTVNGAGAALSWAAEKLMMPNLVLQLPEFFRQGKMPPIFVNTVGGVGSPWWRSGGEARFVGTAAPPQRAVAVAESILFLLKANMDTLAKAGYVFNRIRISGGLSHLDEMCQRLSTLSGVEVYRPADTEATARGIAWLAFNSPNHWPKPGRGKRYTPGEDEALKTRCRHFLHLMDNGAPLS